MENRISINEIAFSVIMPTFNQCTFIRRAIASLRQQTFPRWELIIVNDGSTDRTEEYIADLIKDPRIRYIANDRNRGIGFAINRAIDVAANDYIAYLPSDDFWEPDHLATLAEALEDREAVMAFSGVRYDDCKDTGLVDYKTCRGTIPGYCTQMVQVAHRRTADRWTEEFSKYDAGWLHCVSPANAGSLLRITWADINLPARISTYLVGGIPMIQKRNDGHIFAQRSYLDGYDIDLRYDRIGELVSQLKDRDLMRRKTANVIARRRDFSFEAHEKELTGFFRHIIFHHHSERRK